LTTANRFDAKDPAEKQVLTFDFSLGLATGETLTGTPTVSIAVLYGTDPSPGNVLAGGNAFDPTNTKYFVPVQGGVDLTDYDIVVKASTTNAVKTLTLGGILPVRAQ